MRLYIMRHGHAPSAADAGVAEDSERPLSAQGRSETFEAARGMKGRGARPALILSSPLLRAQQTAQEAAGAFSPAPPVRTYEPLANQLSAAELSSRLKRDLSGEEEVLLVGHQPQLGELASLLAARPFTLRTAGVIALELDARGARLLWTQDPEGLAP